MIVSLIELKKYLGIAGTDNDEFLTQQLMVANSSIENYCGRKFDLTEYTEEFYRDSSSQFNVTDLYSFHYPLVSVTNIVDDNGVIYSDVRIGKDKGKIVLQENNRRRNWFCGYNKLEITYTAGYSTMPPELKQVVFALVGETWTKKQNGIDVNFGKDVQRMSVAGVMSIDFDYTLQANDRKSAFGMILGDWANVLDFYRSERSLGGEIWESYVS